MAIRIWKEPDVYLSYEEHERLQKEYADLVRYMVNPPSFEVWVLRRKTPPQKIEGDGK